MKKKEVCLCIISIVLVVTSVFILGSRCVEHDMEIALRVNQTGYTPESHTPISWVDSLVGMGLMGFGLGSGVTLLGVGYLLGWGKQ